MSKPLFVLALLMVSGPVLAEESREKITSQQKGDRIQVSRTFHNKELFETYSVIWAKGQKGKVPSIKQVERIYPSGIEAHGFWLRSGDYVLKRKGTPWITGRYEKGKCVGTWTEWLEPGKVKRKVECRKGVPVGDAKKPTAKPQFALTVTDFHFEAGHFELNLQDEWIEAKIPRHDVIAFEGSYVIGLDAPVPLFFLSEAEYIKRNRERARAVNFPRFNDNYADNTIVDGTTRTYAWRDGEVAKNVSCYIQCPDEIRRFYVETTEDFFNDPSHALELTAVGSYLRNDR